MMMAQAQGNGSSTRSLDVVIVGAGFAGMYMLYKLRNLGFTAKVIERADGVGGTWYWNRYPGCRCDVESLNYSFSFDPQLEQEWTWSERYSPQPEILAYANHVADRFDLRKDIEFQTGVERAEWDEDEACWTVTTTTGETISARFYIMATGCLSQSKLPEVPGIDTFTGPTYHTGHWPHEGVDFTAQRVAVIGTGSSGIQSIPLIAQQATQLTVFQRTPNFSIPAGNGPVPQQRLEQLAADRDAYREAAKWSRGGIPQELTEIRGTMAPPEVRRERFEAAWEAGELFAILGVFADQGVNPESNEIVAEMIREKIRAVVTDPQTAETLC